MRPDKLPESLQHSFLPLAVALAEVRKYEHYKHWRCEDFPSYVATLTRPDGEAMSLRTAQDLARIGEAFGPMSEPVLKWVVKLGWAAATKLAGRVTEENFPSWRDGLEGKTVGEVVQFLKESQDVPDSPEDWRSSRAVPKKPSEFVPGDKTLMRTVAKLASQPMFRGGQRSGQKTKEERERRKAERERRKAEGGSDAG